jgi:hypothetical protein
MKTCYIAGPMKGIPTLQLRRLCDAAAAKLRSEGWNVISPADLDRAVGFDRDNHARHAVEMLRDMQIRDIEAIFKSDAIFVLDRHWAMSKGATAEICVARWRDIPAYSYTTREPLVTDTVTKVADSETVPEHGVSFPKTENGRCPGGGVPPDDRRP